MKGTNSTEVFSQFTENILKTGRTKLSKYLKQYQ